MLKIEKPVLHHFEKWSPSWILGAGKNGSSGQISQLTILYHYEKYNRCIKKCEENKLELSKSISNKISNICPQLPRNGSNHKTDIIFDICDPKLVRNEYKHVEKRVNILTPFWKMVAILDSMCRKKWFFGPNQCNGHTLSPCKVVSRHIKL